MLRLIILVTIKETRGCRESPNEINSCFLETKHEFRKDIFTLKISSKHKRLEMRIAQAEPWLNTEASLKRTNTRFTIPTVHQPRLASFIKKKYFPRYFSVASKGTKDLLKNAENCCNIVLLLTPGSSSTCLAWASYTINFMPDRVIRMIEAVIMQPANISKPIVTTGNPVLNGRSELATANCTMNAIHVIDMTNQEQVPVPGKALNKIRRIEST